MAAARQMVHFFQQGGPEVETGESVGDFLK